LIPPSLPCLTPTSFLKALGIAGGFGVALLLGEMPILMVWAGRYYQGYSLSISSFREVNPLSALMAFVLFEISIALL